MGTFNPERDIMAATSSALPSVKHESEAFHDLFWGTKEDLLLTRVCQPEWFQVVPKVRKNGAQQRRFRVVHPDRGTDILLVDQRDGTWFVRIEASAEECKKRRQADEAKRRQAHEAASEDKEVAYEKTLRRRLTTLPKFVPGSMSEGEIHAMRVMRALDDRHWDDIVSFAERFLVSEQRDESQKIPAERPRAPRLQLVVDNDQPARK